MGALVRSVRAQGNSPHRLNASRGEGGEFPGKRGVSSIQARAVKVMMLEAAVSNPGRVAMQLVVMMLVLRLIARKKKKKSICIT